MKRLYRLVLLFAASLWLAISALHADVTVPVASDLQQLGEQAQSRQLPILLTFTSIICSYCELLEQDFLQPMLLSGEYRDRVMIRKLELGPGTSVTDFNGQTIMASQLSSRYRVFVTPTLLFVDGNGKELAERIVGINTPELYGGYLDDCIETALLHIRDPEAAARLSGCQLQNPADSETIFRTAAP
ncbi:MAG: thioredoxin fold domain-containing protein [Gammaproteobacteria bacterium]|jgi:thioredoxin-related protein